VVIAIVNGTPVTMAVIIGITGEIIIA